MSKVKVKNRQKGNEVTHYRLFIFALLATATIPFSLGKMKTERNLAAVAASPSPSLLSSLPELNTAPFIPFYCPAVTEKLSKEEAQKINNHSQELWEAIDSIKLKSQYHVIEDKDFAGFREEFIKYCPRSDADLELLTQTFRSIKTYSMHKKITDLVNELPLFVQKEDLKVRLGKIYTLTHQLQIPFESVMPPEKVEALLKENTPHVEELVSSCTNVDFTNEEVLGPIRDQNAQPWCYAYAAADLVSFAYGTPVSALDVALSDKHSFLGFFDFAEVKTEAKSKGGNPALASANILSRGACTEKDLPSEVYSDSRNKFSKQLQFLDQVKRDIDWLSVLDKESKDYQKSYNKLRKNILERVKRKSDWQKIFDQSTPEELLQALQNSTSKNILKNLSEKQCKNRLPARPDLEVVQMNLVHGRKELMKKLHEEISSFNPVNLSFSYGFMKDPVDIIEHKLNKKAGHSNTVFGRRYNSQTGRCEFKLRNTWGKSCKGYNKDVECKEGYLWVSESTLEDWLWYIAFIKRQKTN